jgi:glycerol-3-phosphate acyltransferase PlsY
VNLGLALGGAYLLGAVPTSYLAGRLARGIDLREHGSHNLGATNVYRVLGWRLAVPVALLDIAKGALPVWLLAPRVGPAPWIPLAIGAAAVVGHVFSVFVGMRGGKGVATAAGVVLALAPVALLAAFGVWVLVLAGSGYVSLASVSAAIAFPLLVFLLGGVNPYIVPVGVVLAAFIVFTHRDNLRRLAAGRESRFGRRRA